MDANQKHEEIMRRFDAIYAVDWPQREAALAARRFEAVRGASYEGQGAPLDADAEEHGGPAKLEIPTFLRPIRRIRGEYRASRKSVDFKPKGDDSDRASANNLDGLYRADENESRGGGQHAYDNAFTEGSSGGLGGWRYRARYEDDEDEDNDHQRISIDPIYDADQSLWFDINAKAQDKSDARHAFLTFTMTREAFEEQYPDADISTFTTPKRWSYDWTRPDTLTLAEYYEIEDRSVVRRTFRQTILEGVPLPDEMEPDERTYDEEALKEVQEESGLTLESELRAKGYRQVRKRTIKRQAVRKYLVSGAEILEDEGLIAGPNIPLVPFYMERTYVDGIERFRGMVEPVRDAAILFNLGASNLADAASGPTEKTPIFAPEQMDGGIGQAWASRKVDRPAYLLARPIYDAEGNNIIAAGPTAWVEPDQIQPTTAAVLQIAGGAIDKLMGVNEQAENVPANTSAAAIQLVNERGDVHDVLWEDNFAIAMQRGGEIWLGMAKDLYVEEGRRMTAIDMEGKQSTVTLGEAKMDEGGQHAANDLSVGKYDVIVDVGPATKTRRDAVVKSALQIAEMYQKAGNLDNANAFVGIAAMNTEGEGLDGARDAIRKQLVQSGFEEPTEAEKLEAAQAAQNAPPDPNQLLAQAQMVAAQAEVQKAEVQKVEAETKRITAMANLKVAEARAAALLASIDRDDAKQILAEVQATTDSDRADAKQEFEEVRAAVESDRADLTAARTMAETQRQNSEGRNGDAD